MKWCGFCRGSRQAHYPSDDGSEHLLAYSHRVIPLIRDFRNPKAWQEYQKLIVSNSTTSMTFTADDAAASGATLATGAALFDDEWLNYMKKELSAEDWRMLFMCEWPQADKEQAA
ncbi:hypothetical protein V5043_06955 [Enterobacter kobei]|uniref:hypothetical protein n=1 Tax=Enterobacter kobei TaxID=208224 RepID=UPI0030761EFF